METGQTTTYTDGAASPAPIVKAAVEQDNRRVIAAPSSPKSVSSPQSLQATNPVDQIARAIKKFIFLKEPSLYRLLALWVTSTHMYEEFDSTGYIFAFSPEAQSGKSVLLELLETLVAKSSGILISPSEAILFRTAAGHTQFLDEVDSLTNRDQLLNILNAGYHKGGTVKRLEESGGTFEPRGFSVYGPRALAGIGSHILSPATRDRTFGVEMVRQLKIERRDRFRRSKFKPEADEIRTGIAAWVGKNKERILTCYNNYNFPYLEDFRDRTIDVSQPLAAILEVAYENTEILGDVRRELVNAIAATRNDGQPVTEDLRILEALAYFARKEDPLIGNAQELSQRCAEILGQKPDEIPVSSVLRRFNFQTKSVRKPGEDPRHRYCLPSAQLDDLLARYGGTPKTANEGAAIADVVSVVSQAGVISEDPPGALTERGPTLI